MFCREKKISSSHYSLPNSCNLKSGLWLHEMLRIFQSYGFDQYWAVWPLSCMLCLLLKVWGEKKAAIIKWNSHIGLRDTVSVHLPINTWLILIASHGGQNMSRTFTSQWNRHTPVPTEDHFLNGRLLVGVIDEGSPTSVKVRSAYCWCTLAALLRELTSELAFTVCMSWKEH